MNITNKDVSWSIISITLQIISNLIVLPFVLKFLTSEDFGIWTIFITINSFVFIFDFGFSSTFTRNISFIYSGAKNLKAEGFNIVDNNLNEINYSLLKTAIKVMRKYYLFASILFLLIIASLGTYYIFTLLQNYSGNRQIVLVAWFLYVAIMVGQLFTLYYDSLLRGKGMIKQAKQIIIIAQGFQIIATIMALLFDFGLISLVIGQLVFVIINRVLAYKVLFTKEFNAILQNADEQDFKSLFKIFYPNSLKIGGTAIGGFLVTKSVIFVGSFYLTLSEIGSYGITKQILDVIAGVGTVYLVTFYPNMIQLRATNNLNKLKYIYIKGKYFLYIVFIFGALFLYFAGDLIIELIGSQTLLLRKPLLVVLILITFLESNHSMSAYLLTTKNEIPFFKASILSGFGTLLILLIYYPILSINNLWGLLIAQGLVQIVYQNWKWPYSAINDLNITKNDLLIWKKS